MLRQWFCMNKAIFQISQDIPGSSYISKIFILNSFTPPGIEIVHQLGKLFPTMGKPWNMVSHH